MSVSRQAQLMKELDDAALALLKRHFKAEENLPPVDAVKQIKAFSAVVNYYGPRTKLGGDEDTKESSFDRLKSKLHGGRRRAPGSGTGAAAPAANGAGIPDDAAGTGGQA